MIARGISSREIADTLGLSTRTVEAHIVAIFNKLGVRSRVELTASLLGPSGSSAKPVASSLPITNLPLQRTSLIGREPDIANIAKTLEESRLVTVTGPAGVGKTRTALAVGDALLEGLADGVWFVELAELVQGSTVELAVALALNIQESPNCPLLETLLGHLKGKSLLLILDNCEHVLVEARALADAVIGACPRVRIVATSRELLRVLGEQTYKLPTLRVPLPHETQRITAAEAETYPSVSLFTKRAQAIHHAFELSDENAPITAEICLRLDGVPLAIELAAAQVNSLSVHALLARLDQQLRILRSGNQSALPRHQSIGALMDSSYDLLPSSAQQLFEKLSIFAGGCTLSAATAACADDGTDDLNVLKSLSSLIDKSLVIADLSRSEPRYRLLETSRHYAYDKLVARRKATTMARRHAVAYVELAERMEREHDVNPNSAWFTRAGLELENYRAALDWALRRRGDIELGQRLAGSITPLRPSTVRTQDT
jgi:predicted ATPase